METKIKPLDFTDRLGKPKNLYTTTIENMLYAIFLFSLFLGLIGLVALVYFVTGSDTLKEEGAIYLIFGLVIAFYIFIGNRYRYIATFEDGLVNKTRFNYKLIFYKDIKSIKYQNISPVANLLRKENRKENAIDIFLKDGSFMTLGGSKRVFKMTRYPRIMTGVRILDIDKLNNELIKAAKSD